MEAPLSYLAQGTLQLGFSSKENFFSRKAHISSAASMMERAVSTGQTFEGSFEDLTRSMSSSAKNSTSAGSRKRRPGSDLLRLGHASSVSWSSRNYTSRGERASCEIRAAARPHHSPRYDPARYHELILKDCQRMQRSQMLGLGTLINVVCIVAGGAVGLLASGIIDDRLQQALLHACGVCVIFVGASGVMQHMLVAQAAADGTISLSTQGTMMMLVSFALGTVAGELLDIDARFETLGEWLRDKTGSSGDTRFVDGFVSASLTVCIGAMAIVGSIQDGLSGDWSTLALKGALDAVIVCSMAASMGRGCLFAALPVGVLQGTVTALATLLHPIMTTAALANLSLAGSALIFCVGVNLIWPRTFKPANMLPAVAIAVVCAFV